MNQTSPASIDAVLTADHVRLDRIFDEVRGEIERGASRSRVVLEVLRRELLKHMEWEEKLLFPAILEANPRYKASTLESLTIDHDRLKERLGDLDACLSDGCFEAARKVLDEFRAFLEGHNRDEEKGIYIDADRMISEQERRRILARWPVL